MSSLQVDVEFQAVFSNREDERRKITAQGSDDRFKPFQLTYVGIRAFVNGGEPGLLKSEIGKCLLPKFRARGQRLKHKHIAVTIHDQAREAI